MFGGLNNSAWPVGLTAAVAAMCLVVGLREVTLRRREHLAYLWPAFWFITALLLAVMAVGQARDFGALIADLGRREALSNEWYEGRRSAQTLVVGAVAAVWAITALVAIWRVPERRRRYLPMALIVSTLVCFGAIRVVSLHQIDTVLYLRHIGDVEIGRFIELVGLSLALITATLHLAVWPRSGHVAGRRPGIDDATAARDMVRSTRG